MTDNGYLVIVAAVIGGLIAGGVGWFLDWRRTQALLNSQRILYLTGIRDDLEYSLSLYDKIQDQWDKSQTVWLSTLNEMRESRQTYLTNKDHIVLIERGETRKRLFRYYLKSDELLNHLQYQQIRADEISRQFRKLQNEISLSQSALDIKAVTELAVTIMKEENTEFDNIRANIPKNIERLCALKSECQELINVLA